MCGICGITWDDQNLIRKMGEKIKHRGPEQEGFYIDDYVSLCCERLRILDLSDTAKQPQHNEDNSIWVVLNGEIYNFRKIKSKLETNHTFYTNSDTEVILHAYEEYGEDCLNHLNGMFAFAIWDTKKKKLIIARDRLGVKPLYYYILNDELLFSSEIKSILQLDDCKRELNNEALCQFITYAYTIDGQTLFKNIRELLPGHKIVYSFEDKKITISKYWELKLNQTNFNEDYYLEKLKYYLTESIKLRLESDAPLGALLSGGLDSSLMVAILSKISNDPVKTFTIGFGHDLDEYNEAKIVSEHCGTNHHEIQLTYNELTNSLPSILWHMEFPFGRPSILSNYMIAKEVKKYVTVAYTGEGADELFGGYNRYLQYANEQDNISLEDKIVSISSGFFNEDSIRKKIFSQQVLQHYDSPSNPKYAFGDIVKSENPACLLNKALFFEFKTEIPGAQTWRIDRTGSAHAVELREPFLDYNLVEFALSIPSNLKINNSQGLKKKYILQKLGSQFLPEEIVKRKKFPWGMPFYDFFKNEFLPIAESLLEKSIIIKRSYLNFNDSYIKELCQKVVTARDGSITTKDIEINDKILRQILFLFNLELWYKIFIESDDLKNPNLSLNNFI